MVCSICKKSGHNKITCPEAQKLPTHSVTQEIITEIVTSPEPQPERKRIIIRPKVPDEVKTIFREIETTPPWLEEDTWRSEPQTLHGNQFHYTSSSEPWDYSRTMDITFDKLVANSGDIMTFNALKVAYALNKSAFRVIGEPHTDRDGNRCYITVRITTPSGRYESVHLYGVLRFGKFRVTDGSIIMFGKKASWSFERLVIP
jgi:hypothetical protein